MSNTKTQRTWEDLPREDLKHISRLIEMGWLPIFSYTDKRYKRTDPDNCPHDNVSFEKGDSALRYSYGWLSDPQGWRLLKFDEGGYCTNPEYIGETLEEFVKTK